MIGISKSIIRTCLIFLCFVSTQVAYAQWSLDIQGTVISQNDRSKLAGAKVTVLRNGSKSDQITADAKGKFAVALGPDAKYMLEFSNPGYVTKRISFDTRFVPPDVSEQGNFLFRFDMTLFQEVDGLDVSILNKPLAEVKYDPKVFDFSYDKAYTKSIKSQIEKLQSDLEASLAAAAAASAALAKQYDDAMADGNKAMGHEDYLIAIGHYESALEAKPGDKAATDKIADARKKHEKQKEAKATETAYKEAIENAEMALHDGNLKEAEAQFEKALEAKPQDTYARDQLKEVRASIVALAKAEQTYITAIGKADAALAAKDFITAKAEYTKASEAKPNEEYPKVQLEQVEALLLADAQKESDYIKAIERAEISLENKDYEAAKAAFEQASEIKPGEKYPKDEVAKIVALMAAIELKNKNYNDAIKKADDLLKVNDFESAKTAYREALDIKPEEQYPKDQIAAIETQLAEMEQINAQYNELIADADQRFEAHDYVAAKAEYQKALDLKPNESHPADRITEISGILEDLAKVEEDYKHAISNGDNAFGGKDYNSAKFEYQTASKLKPDEQYPKDQIAKIDELLAEIAKQDEEYNAAIAAGDEQFKSEDFESAKASYTQASGIKPDEQYPKDQLALIDDKLVELANLNQAYDESIASADKLMEEGKLGEAKDEYQKASDMKPSEAYPKEKIAALVALIAAAEKKDQDYAKLIADGDGALEQKNYEAALTAYTSASEMKPDEAYPKEKITEINQITAELAELQKQYDEAITKADEAYNGGDLSGAVPLYEAAIAIKAEETYPKEQIDKIQAKIQEQEQLESEYQSAIAEGENAEKSEDYQTALTAYEKAGALKPQESLPKEKVTALTALIAELGEKEKAYSDAVSLADEALKNEEFDIAITQYNKASEIKPEEAYPKDQAAKAEELKAAALAAIALQNKKDEDYQALITEADGLLASQDYESAKGKYKEAIEIKPEETYPKDKITEIDGLLASAAEQQAIDEKYAALIASADQSFQSEDYEKAKTEYSEAKSVKPSETYPDEQLKAIDAAIAAAAALAAQEAAKMAQQEKDEKYAALVAEGDASFQAEDWESAKTSYKGAKAIKPEETYPDEQLAAIDAAIAAAAALAAEQAAALAAKEKDEKYNALIASADASFKSEDWESAKADYNSAKQVKPEETYPDDQLAAIDAAIAAAAALADKEAAELAAKEREEKYNALIAEGDASFKAEDWESAKTAYNGAKSVKPEESYPNEQLAAIDAAIAAAAANAEKEAAALAAKEREEKYAALIASADKSFDSKDWESAKADYQEAQTVKPEESYPGEQIKAIDAEIAAGAALAAQLAKDQAAKEKEEQYASMVAAGDKAFRSKDWTSAKSNYQEALSIKPGEAYPQDQIAKIEEELLAQASVGKRSEYDAYISTADQAFKSKDWESAKSNYQSALSVLPDEEYPKGQLKRIEDEIAQAEAIALRNKSDEEYRQLIGDADQLFNNENYSASKDKYKEALSVKPEESYPKNRIAEIDEKIAALAAAGKAVDKQYNDLIAKGDKAFDAENFEVARSAYQEALSMKRGESSYPADQIDKIDQILADREADLARKQNAAEMQRKYDKLIATADNGFSAKQYETAKSKYKEALSVKPGEAYPQKKIDEIDEILAAQVVVAPTPTPKKSSSGMSEAEIAAMMLAWQNERDQAKTDELNQYKADLKEESDDRVASSEERRMESSDELVDLEQTLKESNKAGENRNLDEAMLVAEFKDDQEKLQQDLSSDAENKRNDIYQDIEETEVGQKEMKEEGNQLYLVNTEKMTTEKIEYQDQQKEDRATESEKLEDSYGDVVDIEEGIRDDNEANHDRYMKDVERIENDNKEVIATINNWNEQEANQRNDSYDKIHEQEMAIIDFQADNAESYRYNTEEYWNTVDDLAEYNATKARDGRRSGRAAYGDIKDYNEDMSEVTEERNNRYNENNEDIRKEQLAIMDYQAELTADADEKRLNYNPEFYTGEDQPRYREKAKDYPQGVTEETYQQDEAFVIKRVVVTGENYDEYEKIYYKWGGIFYKKNGEEITEVIWNTETQ